MSKKTICGYVWAVGSKCEVVVKKTGELVAYCPSRQVAEHIVECHNKLRPKKGKTLLAKEKELGKEYEWWCSACKQWENRNCHCGPK